MRQVDEIVQRMGGQLRAAELTGVGIEAVRKWRQAGAIPPRHWPAVIAATGLGLADMPGGAQADAAAASGPGTEAVPAGATAALALADGTLLWGIGFGAHTAPDAPAIGEICFSTGLTGYQETLTDPSFAGQIITFTFPHIGNVGTNADDLEAGFVAARGMVTRELPTAPSNWRATDTLDGFLLRHGVPGIARVDTRALTLRIRDGGFVTAALAYPEDGRFDADALIGRARAWPGLEGMDLAREVSRTQSGPWHGGLWAWGAAPEERGAANDPHVVAVDYGAKRNILRSLVSAGMRVTVVPASTDAEAILRLRPDGVFLSNGPGDPAATAAYAVPAIEGVLAAGIPLFGICLGHQLLGRALGGGTVKLRQGHRGANQPVRENATGRVEITSQNHGFAVDEASLPPEVTVTHSSLFDGSNEGLACPARRCFSVQYHPEAGPGPSGSRHLFARFRAMITGADATA